MRRSPLRQRTPRRAGSTTLRSDDGALQFTLAPVAHGVFVERVAMRGDAARVVQTVLFTDGGSFDRWCDTDTTRFDYPVLYVRLKRDGGTFFGSGTG